MTQKQTTIYVDDNGTRTEIRMASLQSAKQGVVLLNRIPGVTASLKEPTMRVRNPMSGKEVEIPVSTPWCCNPASEIYWSM